MKRIITFILAGGCWTALSTGHQSCAASPADQASTQQLAVANTAFALDLYHQLQAEPGNLFFSPYSISSALAMTYAGAKGDTAKQMAQTLHLNLDPALCHASFAALQKALNQIQQQGQIQLSVANSLWPQKSYSFLPDYLELLQTHYAASLLPCDYAANTEAARQKINQWVEDKTNQKIQNLIPAGILTPLTRLVLVNAIYFKGNWATQFNPQLTQTAPFHLTPAQSVDIPLMAIRQSFGYAAFDDLQVLALDYLGQQLSMIVLLPKEVEGLPKLEAALSTDNLAQWTAHLPRQEVQVFLPKFKMASTFQLNGALKALGMSDAFDDTKADFSGMNGRHPDLYLSAAVHKAFIEVNEEGSEAAAATGIVIGKRALPPPSPVFRADHPFLFLIRENRTGSILFLGRMTNPAP